MTTAVPHPLPEREQCTQNLSCDCVAFIFGSNYRRIPLDPGENCRCTHPWWMHVADPPSAAGRGGCLSSGCGGYHPQERGPNPRPCVCGKPYDHHDQLVSGLSGPNVNETAASVSRNPPSAAFANVPNGTWNLPASAVNAANRDRMNAAVRHRPPRTRSKKSQPTPQASSERATVHEFFFGVWPFALDPDYSYTGHPPPQTVFSLRHFSEVVEHLNKHDLLFRVELHQDVSDPWKQINRSLDEHLTDNSYQLPLRPDDDGKKFSTLSWDVLVQVGRKKDDMLMKSGTVGRAQFTVQFLVQKAIQVQLEYNGIDRTCECLLLAPTHGNLRGPIPQGPQRFREHACLPWRLMARYKWLQLKSNEDGDECIDGECPSGESGSSAGRTRVVRRVRSPYAGTPERCNVNHLRRSRSPSREEIDTEHRDAMRYRRTRNAPILDSDGNSDLEAMEPPKKDQTAVQDMAIDDMIDVDRMDFQVDDDLYDEAQSPVLENLTRELNRSHNILEDIRMTDTQEWQRRIRAQSGEEDFEIQAPSPTTAAAVLIDLVKTLGSDIALDLPKPDPPIVCNIKSGRGLLTPMRPFKIGNAKRPDRRALGDGPSSSVFQGALNIRLADDNRWTPSHGNRYRSLNFSYPPDLVPKAYRPDFQVDGSLTALVMIQLLQEPHPVNPFLVYAAFFENYMCLDFLLRPYKEYKPEHLLAMIPDPQTRIAVAGIMNFPHDKNVSVEQAAEDPVMYRASMSEEIRAPLVIFKTPRDDEQHQKMICGLLAETLIGVARPWEYEQFKRFREGLQLPICDVDDIVKPRSETDTNEDIYLYAFRLVAALWNNRIESSTDVLTRIKITCVCERELRKKAGIYARLFVMRLQRWIKGKGHPHQLVGNIISKDDNKKDSLSPKTIRAQMFWKAATDSVVLSPAGIKDVNIRLKFMPKLFPSRKRIPFHISVCTQDMEFVLDPEVMNLLLEPGVLTDSADTAFDLWFHALMASSANDYNDV